MTATATRVGKDATPNVPQLVSPERVHRRSFGTGARLVRGRSLTRTVLEKRLGARRGDGLVDHPPIP